ncbi:unnamed protein product [Phytophthora fragariaefolia]|uniref:Unnamed protein product n=1 Tax=Phytophthora fragariaefolia TaxID=1490495 RepID=A0A9W6X0V2_9STRA|nr:unnamed protein product [Phytophthora fragariaefolia]
MKKYRIPDLECKIAMRSGVLDMLTVVPQEKVERQGIAWVTNAIKERCDDSGISYSVTKWSVFWRYFRPGIEKLARRYANWKHDIEFGRARHTSHPPIRLPRPVSQPDTVPSPPNLETTLAAHDELRDNGVGNCLRRSQTFGVPPTPGL